MFIRILLSVSFLFLCRCATVIRMPNSTGQVPETVGGTFKWRLGLDVMTTTPVTIINNVTTTPVTRDRILVGEDQSIIGEALVFDAFAGTRFDLNMGILSRLDVYYEHAFGLRYQLFGQPRKEGWKATLFAGYFNSQQGSSVENTTLYEAEVSMKGVEFGASVGKRLSKSTLWYLTLASRGGEAEIDILQNQIMTEEYSDEFDHYVATLGVYLGSSWYFKGELSANYVGWQGQNSFGTTIEDDGFDGGLNLGFGYRWGE